MKKHYTYKITNLKTGEYYLGVRSCSCDIKDDTYMGSSSIWTKSYIRSNKENLIKEIVEEFETRKLANDGEVCLLKQHKDDPLCINCYFDYTPDVTGTKQTEEWIAKRIKYGEENGMFGKHHSDKVRQRIREKLLGRTITAEARKKIGDFHRGKINSEETRNKISKARQKLRLIRNIHTNEEWIISITDFIKMFPDENFNANSMRKAAQEHCVYRKTYIISEAPTGDSSCKLGENGEHPEVDNPVGSIGNE